MDGVWIDLRALVLSGLEARKVSRDFAPPRPGPRPPRGVGGLGGFGGRTTTIFLVAGGAWDPLRAARGRTHRLIDAYTTASSGANSRPKPTTYH